MTDCANECQCDAAGYCPVYGITMGPSLYKKCKSSEVWRDNFKNFFTPSQEEDAVKERQVKAELSKEKIENAHKLDEVISHVEKAGVDIDNYTEKQEGLGDLLGNVFSRLGITEEAVEKWAGIGGCGCDKRKKFLNKILPFRKSEPSIAPKKKES